jgi:hypothetical protein
MSSTRKSTSKGTSKVYKEEIFSETGSNEYEDNEEMTSTATSKVKLFLSIAFLIDYLTIILIRISKVSLLQWKC